MLKLTWILLLLLFPLSAKAGDQISRENFDSQGKHRTYYLYAPDSTKTSAPVPLVVLLHGSGRNGLSLVETWKDLARKEGFIIVGPDASNTSSWRTPEDGPEFIHDLVEMLIEKYNIDPNHIYLFGHSAGAVFALGLAMFESEYFAAVAVHAGSWHSQKEFSLLEFAQRKIPLKIIVGDQDRSFPLDSVKATEKALRERSFPIEVTIIKGHDHWYYDLAPQINQNAWDFLKQNVLPGARRHVQYNYGGGGNAAGGWLNEVNALRLKADKLITDVYAKEDELRGKDRDRDKAAASEIARAQIQALTESAKIFREAAAAAERASKKTNSSNDQQVLSLIASASIKRAETVDLLRQRAELLLTDEETNSINVKRNELVNKATALNEEAMQLESKARTLRGG